MENKRPEFAIAGHSVLSVVTEMHSYFRDLQSYYKITKGDLISRLEDSNDETEIRELQKQLHEVDEMITVFHVLNNSISTVDVILHTDKMIAEFGMNKTNHKG